MGPAAFAQHMRTLIDAGAALVGGCCGTDPRYISALRDVLPDNAPPAAPPLRRPRRP